MVFSNGTILDMDNVVHVDQVGYVAVVIWISIYWFFNLDENLVRISWFGSGFDSNISFTKISIVIVDISALMLVLVLVLVLVLLIRNIVLWGRITARITSDFVVAVVHTGTGIDFDFSLE